MTFQQMQGFRPIEELTVPFDPTRVADRVQRRKRSMRSRVVSLVITVIFLVVIYFWQRDSMAGAGFVTLYAVVLGVSVAWFAVYLVGFLMARRDLRRVGQGIALRIGRPGVEVRGVYVPWAEVGELAAVKGGLGRSPELQLTRTTGERLRVPLEQIDVRPATLDLTARAYSAGRQGVDLGALDS